MKRLPIPISVDWIGYIVGRQFAIPEAFAPLPQQAIFPNTFHGCDV